MTWQSQPDPVLDGILDEEAKRNAHTFAVVRSLGVGMWAILAFTPGVGAGVPQWHVVVVPTLVYLGLALAILGSFRIGIALGMSKSV